MDSDLLRGNVDTIILKCLSRGELYGVEICGIIREASGGTYELKAPTMYSALKRLKNKNLVSSYWKDSPIGGQRHYYKLTEAGIASLGNKKNDWVQSKDLIDNLVFDARANNIIPMENAIPISASAQTVSTPLQEEHTPIITTTVTDPETNTLVAVATKTQEEVSPLDKYVASNDYITVPLSHSTPSPTTVAATYTAPAPAKTVLTPAPAALAPVAAISSSAPVMAEYNTPAQLPPLRQAPVPRPAPVQMRMEVLPIKSFVKHASDKKSGKFVLYNKLRLACSTIVCIALATGLVCTNVFLKPAYSVEENTFFIIAGVVAGIYLLCNIALYAAYPKYKRIISTRPKDIAIRGTITLCLAIAAVSVNIIAGLSSVNATDFMVYWIIPCILASAFLIEGITIALLRRSRIFLT